MHCEPYTATFAYLEGLSASPAGVEHLHDSDLPADVVAELGAAGIGIPGFFKLIPLLLELFQLFSGGGTVNIAEVFAKIMAILAALKPQS